MTILKNHSNLLIWIGLCLIYALYPGNVSWINDEAILIWKAWDANQNLNLNNLGLYGSKGVPFGSFPVLCYQLLLLITANLEILVILKSILFVSIIYSSSLAICNLLKISRVLALIPVLNIFTFHYSRILWDNCFLIPLAFVWVWIYLRQMAFPQLKNCFGLAIIACLLLQTHLTALLLIVPLCLFLIIKQFFWLRKRYLSLFCLITLILTLNYPYFNLILTNWESTSNPFQLISGINIIFGHYTYAAWFFIKEYLPEFWHLNYKYLLILVLTVNIISLIIILSGLLQAVRKKNEVGTKLLIFLAQVIFIAALIAIGVKLEAFPHYLNSLSPIYFLLLILGWKGIAEYAYARIALYALLFSQLLMIIFLQLAIYKTNGTKSSTYGSTLRNQLEVATAINSYQKVQLSTNIQNYQRFPHSLQTLIQLTKGETKNNQDGSLIITYRDSSPLDGHLMILEEKSPAVEKGQKKGR